MFALKVFIIYFFIYLKAAGLSGDCHDVQVTKVVYMSRLNPSHGQETVIVVSKIKLNHMDNARHISMEAMIEKSMIITPPAQSMRKCRGGGELQMHCPMMLFPPHKKFFHFVHPTKHLLTSLKGWHNEKAAGLSGAVHNVQDIKVVYGSRLCRKLPTMKLNHKDNTLHIKMEALIKKSITIMPSALSVEKCKGGGELQKHHLFLCPPPSKVFPPYSPYQTSTFITEWTR